MKITALEVRNFKRVEDVAIAPGDRNLLIIGGRNRQGKSSVLDALSAAFGGKREVPEQPVRAGAKKAEIVVTLDGLVVKRTISQAGTQQIKVSDANGTPIKSPQKALTALVGARFLDPLAFLGQTAKEQREALLGCVDLELDLDEWETARKALYDERTNVGRDVRRLAAEIDALGEVEEVEPRRTADLAEELDALLSQERECTAAVRDLDVIDRRGQELRDDIDGLEAQLAAAKAEIGELGQERATQAALVRELQEGLSEERREELRLQIETAEEHNQKAAAATAKRERLTAAEEALATAQAAQESLTAEIEAADDQKAKALAAAEMPIAGLDVDEEQVLYDGVPLSQASGAQQLEVSLGIAMALKPELRDVWVKDGSLLDADSLEIVRKLAAENDCRVWLERVGDADADCIVIEAGKVVDA